MTDQRSTANPATPSLSDILHASTSAAAANPQEPPPQNDHDDLRRIARISVRPPPFWRENPALWFKQLESQFITNGITASDTKFHIAVSALDTAVISQVSDLVMNPPAQGKYELLKQRLQERFADSEEQRFRKLLSSVDLGDRKPSHLWREMRELAGNNNFNEQVLRSLWMQRLPTQSQAILSAEEGNMERILTLAYRIHEIFGSRQVAAVSVQAPPTLTPKSSNNQQSPSSQQCAITQLCEQVSHLTTHIAELTGNSTNHSSRGRSRSTNRSERTPSRGKTPHPNCWYHHRYGKDAKKCIKPCAYNNSPSEN